MLNFLAKCNLNMLIVVMLIKKNMYRSRNGWMKKYKSMVQKVNGRCGGIGNTIRHILMDFPLMDERCWLEQKLFHASTSKWVKDQMPVHF